MISYQKPVQQKLFYTGINLDSRIRKDHPLRRIAELIDFDFSYKGVERYYGKNGNKSVPPPVILKLMLLLIFYNVRSERELMETLPERLDWLWFLGYDLDTKVPNHSVLSKARSRWGAEIFKEFFERIVKQYVEAGLVEGSKIFVDSSFIDANASKNSVVDMESLKRFSNERYMELESRLEEITEVQKGKVNKRFISTTDPEAGIVRKGGSRSTLCYQTHRAVDSSKKIITGTEVTRGDVNEAHRMIPLWEKHNQNTGLIAETIVGDSKYGTIDNYIACYERGLKAHMPNLRRMQVKRLERQNICLDSAFTYDSETDTYICPTGNRLKKKSYRAKFNSIEYKAPKKECNTCHLRSECTQSKTGRTIKRHIEQDNLDIMLSRSESNQEKKDIRTRQHLVERSFATSTRYNFDRARWRGLSRVAIQEYLVCSIQNIAVLMLHGRDLTHRGIQAIKQIEYKITKVMGLCLKKTTLYLLRICDAQKTSHISQKNILEPKYV
jgi:transposase